MLLGATECQYINIHQRPSLTYHRIFSDHINLSPIIFLKMVATRSHKQPKEEEPMLETAAGGGIKAPARRVRAKKVEPETNDEEKPKITSKKAVSKSRAKTVAKKEPEQEPEADAQAEELPKVEAKKPAPRSRAKAAAKPQPDPEIKVTKRSTRAAAPSLEPSEPVVTVAKTRKTSQTKGKAEVTTKAVLKSSESEEKPKGRGRKPSASKKQTKKQDEKQLPTVEEDLPESQVTPASNSQEHEDALQAGPVIEKITTPIMSPSSKIPRNPLGSPTKSNKPSSPVRSFDASHSAMSPSRSIIKDSPPKLSASMNPFRSSVLSSPDKTLGSPRKPAVQQKQLLSPAKPRRGSPFRISHLDAPSARRFNIQSPFAAPRLRPAASESQLAQAARHHAVFAAPPAQRPSTSAGPSAATSPAKSSLRPAGALSPKKSVTFHGAAPAPATPQPAAFAQPAALAAPPPTPRPQVFAGLSFVVDVRDHRSGADASGLFAPLLVELGARVERAWASSADDVTHVLFKDGDLLTLEKVVAARGAVLAVNVGYALDCEREGCRLDEGPYLIDLASVPGLCTPAKSSASASAVGSPAVAKSVARTPLRETLAEIEFPTIAGLRIKTPSFVASKGAAAATTPFVMGAAGSVGLGMVDEEDKENASPTPANMADTPILQKSCPAKQEHKPLFSFSSAKDATMTPLKMKLMGAKRRETMMPSFGK